MSARKDITFKNHTLVGQNEATWRRWTLSSLEPPEQSYWRKGDQTPWLCLYHGFWPQKSWQWQKKGQWVISAVPLSYVVDGVAITSAHWLGGHREPHPIPWGKRPIAHSEEPGASSGNMTSSKVVEHVARGVWLLRRWGGDSENEIFCFWARTGTYW